MALIRHIASQFDLVYLKPSMLARAVRELAPVNPYHAKSNSPQAQNRVTSDRRSGIDRRKRDRHVLLDLRSAYPRRSRSGRRVSEGEVISIDVYA